MIWIVLLLVAGIGIFVNSFRLFFFALVSLLIITWPFVAVPSIGAVIIWAIKHNLRR
jgi:hypothetical protein